MPSSSFSRGPRPDDSSRVPLVALAADHPGFSDNAYRARRDAIAGRALRYRAGDPPPEIAYTEEEHATWRLLLTRLGPLHERHRSRALGRLDDRVRLPSDRIPQLSEVNGRLARHGGFRFRPVAGLVESRTFLMQLERGIFLSTQYMRHASRPLYTPEPDVVHELVGHAASLAGPPFTTLNRMFGRTARRARSKSALRAIDRLYWYTLEFGLVREGADVRAFGAGLLSSPGELERCMDVPRRAFDPAEIAETPYDPTAYQDRLFVAPDFDSLIDSLRMHLERLVGGKEDGSRA